ncbi:MAG TPA: potassium-transporting ATPase subunit F [Polyangiaceae bacterium]
MAGFVIGAGILAALLLAYLAYALLFPEKLS